MIFRHVLPKWKTWKLHWPRALDLVWYCWCFRHAALRSPAIGDRLVVYPIYKVLASSQVVVWDFWTINRIVWYFRYFSYIFRLPSFGSVTRGQFDAPLALGNSKAPLVSWRQGTCADTLLGTDIYISRPWWKGTWNRLKKSAFKTVNMYPFPEE